MIVPASRGSEPLDALGILPPLYGHESSQELKVRTALRSDDFRSAAAAPVSLAEEKLQDGKAEYWTGLLDLRSGKLEDSIRSFRRSQLVKDSPYTAEGLALAYYAIGQFYLFQQSMMQAASQLPHDFAPPYFLGRYYASADGGDFTLARSYLLEAVSRNPSHVLADYYLGFAEESIGDLDSALKTYNQALPLPAPTGEANGLLLLGLARVYRRKAQVQDAMLIARKAKAVPSQRAEASRMLGILYEESGQWPMAIPEWEVVVQLNPTSTAGYYHLFRLYSRSHQPQKAGDSLTRYKEMASLYGTGDD